MTVPLKGCSFSRVVHLRLVLLTNIRNNLTETVGKKHVLQDFSKFKEKQLCWRLIFDKAAEKSLRINIIDLPLNDCFQCIYIFRSSHRRHLIKKGVLKKIRKNCRKTPVSESLKVARRGLSLAQVFSGELCEIFKNTFLQNILGRQFLKIRDGISIWF